MATEIERKFKVNLSRLPKGMLKFPVLIRQGYLSTQAPVTRIRIETPLDGSGVLIATLTVKGAGTHCRTEEEAELDVDDAFRLLKQCPVKLAKIRYRMVYQERDWTVDLYPDGTCVAEIEFESEEESKRFKESDMLQPPWGKEVTENPEYANSVMAEWQQQYYHIYDALDPQE